MVSYARPVLVVTAAFLAGIRVSGQDATVTKPSVPVAFEVASVRPNISGPGSTFMRRLPASGFEAGNVTTRDLILFAYNVQRYRIVGLSGWTESDRFDISARAGANLPSAPPGTTVEALMLRTLLADRFRLAVHTETRQMQVYALVVARSDGRLGPQLRRSTVTCDANPATASQPNAAQPRCGTRSSAGSTSAVGMRMSDFPYFLAGQLQRPVIDRTGLTGTWDVDLKFAPDGVAGDLTAASPQDTGPSLFTALQEQLGLTLEPSTGPVEVLVIDRIERPSTN